MARWTPYVVVSVHLAKGQAVLTARCGINLFFFIVASKLQVKAITEWAAGLPFYRFVNYGIAKVMIPAIYRLFAILQKSHDLIFIYSPVISDFNQ
jgi:hypothetical protein